jgi:BirA family biotin operon repressor/biotin-[acetyl-CoA-carboxylase] ligase
VSFTIEKHAELPSTQERALDLAAAGAPAGTVVLAARQTAGRGRYGHAWASPEGGLWLSLIADGASQAPPRVPGAGAGGDKNSSVSHASMTRSPDAPERLSPSIVAALAARAAIARAAGLETRLKWPNDLLVARRKLGGIIAAERAGRLVIGIGIDANVRRAALPPEVAAIATSILEETGREAPLPALLQALLDELAPRLERWRRADPRLRDEAWDALIRDHAVRWRPPGAEPREGTIGGLAPSGALELALARGGAATALTGDLEILWPATT